MSNDELKIQQRRAYVLNVLLTISLLLYCAPTIALLYVSIDTSMFSEASSTLEWFLSFCSQSTTSLNLIHKMILPVLAGATVFLYNKKHSTNWFLVVGVFLLINVAVSIYLDAMFSQDDLESNVIPLLSLTIDQWNALESLVHAYFAKYQESIIMFITIMFGLSIK